MKSFIFATSVLVSTIVGVGMFGLPYAGAQSGFLIGAIFLIILAIIMTLLHLFYGEIVSRTKEKHRLVGYAGYYLGRWGKGMVTISVIVGFYGSLLVYIIVGGDFLGSIFSSLINVPSFIFNLIFFIIGITAVYFGLRFIAELDFFMGIFLILIVFLFLYFGANRIDINNFKIINWKNIFIPYGVILYSLAGMAAVPEIRDILKNRGSLYKKVIILGSIIPAILYFVFMITVVGITGLNTSPETISGLAGILGEKIILLGAIFGFLATITSFFILGLSLRETFCFDFKINKTTSWFLVCIVPLILYIAGIRSFIPIIVVLGALMGAIEGSAIVLIYDRAKVRGDKVPDYELKVSKTGRYFMVLVFVLGLIFTLISII